VGQSKISLEYLATGMVAYFLSPDLRISAVHFNEANSEEERITHMVGSQLLKVEEVAQLDEAELRQLTGALFEEIAGSEQVKTILRARAQKTLLEIQHAKAQKAQKAQ
jgi:hypothetical protein